MVASSKKVHCAYCQNKCSGNVLRYQDQYYHKKCFETEQSELAARHHQSALDESIATAETTTTTRTTPTTTPTRQRDYQQHDILIEETNQKVPLTQNRSATLPAQTSNNNNLTSTTRSTQNQRNTTATPITNGFSRSQSNSDLKQQQLTTCAGCRDKIRDGQALIALDLHWHVWCFKCHQCKLPLHGEYVAKDGKAYCERDYQKLFGIACVYCKRYITGKVLQAGEAHHFHPSCARCSKCGDPFIPGEEMYLQGEVTWHPRCGPGPDGSLLMLPAGQQDSILDYDDKSQLRASRAQSPNRQSSPRSRSASPFSFISRQYGRSSPAYADSEMAVGDLSRIHTISYLNADPNQGYLRRPIEPNPPKSPQFSRPASTLTTSRLGGGGADQRSRCSSRSINTNSYYNRDRSVPRGMYSVLSSMRSAGGSSSRARSPSMMNEEAIQLAAYPSGQKPSPDQVPTIERDDFPAPPFPYHPERQHHHHHQQQETVDRQRHKQETQLDDDDEAVVGEPTAVQQQQQQQQQERASRPRSREFSRELGDDDSANSLNGLADDHNQFRKEEEELSKIANGIGKIFLQTLKEREKLRAWKRANLDPRNASRTPSATREIPNRLRYENPTNASPSRDLDRARPWELEQQEQQYRSGEQTPTARTLSSLGRQSAATNQQQLSASAAAVNNYALGSSAPPSASSYGYKVIQSNRSTPKPGYGVSGGPPYNTQPTQSNIVLDVDHLHHQEQLNQARYGSEMSFADQQRLASSRSSDLLGKAATIGGHTSTTRRPTTGDSNNKHYSSSSTRSLAGPANFLRRSMPNVAQLHHIHHDGPPKLYPYHLLATTNYRLPPDVDRCHLERHLSNEEFQYIFHCDRLDFYRLPEWKRNELKRRAKLF